MNGKKFTIAKLWLFLLFMKGGSFLIPQRKKVKYENK